MEYIQKYYKKRKLIRIYVDIEIKNKEYKFRCKS